MIRDWSFESQEMDVSQNRIAHMTTDIEARIRSLRSEGLYFYEIADRMNIPKSRLMAMMDRIGDPMLKIKATNLNTIRRQRKTQKHSVMV